jgi:hypothetical protein
MLQWRLKDDQEFDFLKEGREVIVLRKNVLESNSTHKGPED